MKKEIKTITDFDEEISLNLFGGENIIDSNNERFIISALKWNDNEPPLLYNKNVDLWVNSRQMKFPVYLLCKN
jgi:hypothetical protein